MKRFVMSMFMAVFASTAFVPHASAQEVRVVFQGVGEGRALEVAVPLLNTVSGLLPSVLGNFKGLTAGVTKATFRGLDGAQSTGLAIGNCNLLGTGVSIPLPTDLGVTQLPCAKEAMKTTSSSGDNGSTTETCAQSLALGPVALVNSCAKSMSKVVNGRPEGVNVGGVARIDLKLLPELIGPLGLGDTGNVTGVVGGLVQQVEGLLTPVLGAAGVSNLAPAQIADLTGTVTGVVQSLLGSVSKLIAIEAGTSTTSINSANQITKIESRGAGAKIGILGENPTVDGLIIIDVGLAQSTAEWNDATGSGKACATPAVATVKVKNLLGLGGQGDYITVGVDLAAVGSLLNTVGSLVPSLIGKIDLASATPCQTGTNVSASSTGLGIHLLPWLGSSTPLGSILGGVGGASASAAPSDGGILVRLAASSVSVGGDLQKPNVVPAPLPTTGGPVYAFMAGAAILGAATAMFARYGRRLRRSGADA